MASPFFGRTFTFTQPDGTKFEVRGWGDQHYAVFETLDGYTVVKNPSTGFFEIAQVSSDGTMLQPAPSHRKFHVCPDSGTVHSSWTSKNDATGNRKISVLY